MKQLLKRVLCCFLLLMLFGCSGNFAQVDLKSAIAIPENGMVDSKVFQQIKAENAIAVFQGESNSYAYEWTVFASDLTECRDMNLQVEIETMGDEELQISFAEQRPFDFSALLSIHTNEKWDAQGASVYQNGEAIASVSITGNKETILNISVKDIGGTCHIVPDEVLTDEILAEAEAEETLSANEKEAKKENSYLASVTEQVDPETVYRSKDEDVQVSSKTENKGNGDSDPKKEETTGTKGSNYLAAVDNSTGRVYSDGSRTEKDKYNTDPIPVGKPLPVEPEDQEINDEKTYTCTFSIECSTILNNLSDLDPDKLEMVPSNGTILKKTTVKFYEGESVYDVLQRVCEENDIHMEASWTPIYNSAYVEGIHNLYEFDCGSLSGWMYKVNGWYPNYGCSRYQLKQGDKVEWRYTCDLGHDVGGAYAVGG